MSIAKLKIKAEYRPNSQGPGPLDPPHITEVADQSQTWMLGKYYSFQHLAETLKFAGLDDMTPVELKIGLSEIERTGFSFLAAHLKLKMETHFPRALLSPEKQLDTHPWADCLRAFEEAFKDVEQATIYFVDDEHHLVSSHRTKKLILRQTGVDDVIFDNIEDGAVDAVSTMFDNDLPDRFRLVAQDVNCQGRNASELLADLSGAQQDGVGQDGYGKHLLARLEKALHDTPETPQKDSETMRIPALNIFARRGVAPCAMSEADRYNVSVVRGSGFDWLEQDFMDPQIMAEALYLQFGAGDVSLMLDATDTNTRNDSLAALCNTLTEEIHDDLAEDIDADDLEATSDAFDLHPWAKMREALYDVSPDMTGDKIMRLYAVNEEGHLTYAETAHQYLVRLDGEEAVTFKDPEEAMQHMLNRQSEAVTLRVVTLEQICEGKDMEALSDDLTDAVMAGIPDIDDDARADDFDNHPMAQLRDATMELEQPTDPSP